MQHLSFIPSQDTAIDETIRVCAELAAICQPATATPDNIARALAQSLFGRLPVIYGSYNCTRPVALRWNQQFNENSKVIAHSATFPDFTHNEIVAYGASAQFTASISAIFLRDQDEHPALQRRVSEAQKILRQAGADVLDIQSKGDTRLARMLYLSYLGDFASYYLALLHRVDPTETAQMSVLKRELGLTDLTPGLKKA
jgi:glucose/mannose-6-phosphate isomerase